MAVSEFIKMTDPKQTVEKTVERKPSVEELTTVESPGKPSPASMLEDSPKKAKRYQKSNKAKSSNLDVKISSPKKDSILIITEKPQAAQKIAQALGKADKR